MAFFFLFLDLIFNFIPPEDITEHYVVCSYWVRYKILKQLFSYFSNSYITANYEYTYRQSVIKNPNYYMFRARFNFKTTLNIYTMYILNTELIQVLHNRKYKETIDNQM